MKDFNFSRWNKIIGWVVFVIALYTYASTVEPTASFWDPGEFIATSARLQIGHPPGAPLFQMIGAFISTFATDSTHIALMINLISALSSAFAILFLFWSISLLVRKISGPAEELNSAAKIAVLGSAAVGALAFAFTDSFWFNAVEAEVYAMAMFFMAALFYVGLLWERDMFTPRGNRWVVLLGFLIGLTFGVHFLGILAIPAIGYLYYYKHTEKVTVKNFIIASIIIVGVLLFIFQFLIPHVLLSFYAGLELFFVNQIGLPFGSGTIIATLAFIAAFYYGLKWTRKKGYVNFNTGLLCTLFIFIGFSSWVMLPIRANAGTVINENNPENARALLAYYNREQYPDHALFYGPQFTDVFAGLNPDTPYLDGKPIYEENHKTGKYDIVNNYKKSEQNSPDSQKAFLPRMWSPETSHMENYMSLTKPVKFHLKSEYANQDELQKLVVQVKKGLADGDIQSEGLVQFFNQYGKYLDIEKPTVASNFQYLFSYQFMYMYFRYFMWNFTGRQDDQQGENTYLHGNWLSGINAVDGVFLGSQKNLPDAVKNDPSRNTYYFLPLILGLIGLFFQLDRDSKNFWVVMVLFLFTGLALTFYLNERPFEPRERDYARVGSFFAFAIWIGFGVYALYDILKKYLSAKIVAPLVTVVCLLAVPTVLARQNWNDHDRSGKYTATAMAKNYLDSVGENGILFTIGDNDTFPLWYVQEVEGYRPDVKIINTSLFATSWYIDQVKRQIYDRDSLQTTLQHKDYTGKNDAIFQVDDPRIPDTLSLHNFLKYVKSDDKSTTVTGQNDHTYNIFPTKNLYLSVNKKNVLKYGIVNQKDADKIVSKIPIKVGTGQIAKNTLMMLDVIANLDWKRPVYFSGGSYNSADYLWMKDYLQLEGLCYKLVPIKTISDRYEMGRIDTDEMYDLVMNWHWGGSGNPDMYYDPQTRRNSVMYRSNMTRLIEQLIAENDYDRAKKVIDLAMEKMPVDKFGYYPLVSPFIIDYYEVGEKDKARKIWNEVAIFYQQTLDYYADLSLQQQRNFKNDIQENILRYHDLVNIMAVNDKEEGKEKVEKFNAYLPYFSNLIPNIESVSIKVPSKEDFMKQIQDSSGAKINAQEINDSMKQQAQEMNVQENTQENVPE